MSTMTRLSASMIPMLRTLLGAGELLASRCCHLIPPPVDYCPGSTRPQLRSRSPGYACAYCKGVENVSRQLAFRDPFGILGQSIASASLALQASEQSTDGFLFGGNKLSERGKQTQKCVRPCVAVGLFSFYWYILANKHRANLLRRIVSGFPGKQTNQSIKLIAKNISQRTFISIYSLLSHHPMWAGQQAHCWHVVVLLAYIHQ